MDETPKAKPKKIRVGRIIVLTLALILSGICFYSLVSAIDIFNDTGTKANAAAGLVFIFLLIVASIAGFIASILLCISIVLFSNVRRPEKSQLIDPTTKRKYYNKATLAGLAWMLASLGVVLMFAFLPRLPEPTLDIEPIYLVVGVFGFVTSIVYFSWALKVRSTINVNPVSPASTPNEPPPFREA